MAKDVLKLLKVREVNSPKRGYPTDAGIDFFVPKFTKQFIEDLKEKNESLFYDDDPKYSGNAYTTGITAESGTLTISNGQSQVSYKLSDDNDTKIKFDENEGKNYFLLPPHSRVLIPSGIHSHMKESGRALIAANKSGVASKKGLIFGAQVVDYTYQGEIHINVINTSTENVRIYEDMKLIQFVETPIFTSDLEISDSNNDIEALDNFFKGMIKDRGSDGFGSTDKK